MKSRIAERWLQQQELEQLRDELLPPIVSVYRELTGKEPMLPPLILERGKPPRDGTIAVHKRPQPEDPVSKITVHPKAEGGYLREVVKHELIHYVIQDRDSDPHDELFQAVADRMGLPKRYQD